MTIPYSVPVWTIQKHKQEHQLHTLGNNISGPTARAHNLIGELNNILSGTAKGSNSMENHKMNEHTN